MARITNTGVVFAPTDILSTRGQIIPAGTSWTFHQSTTPLGWTKLTNHNNKSLRLVDGVNISGGGSGGSLSFTSVLSGSKTLTGGGTRTVGSTGNHTLTNAEMSPHNHPFGAGIFNTGGGGDVQNAAGWVRQNNDTGFAGSGNSHNHPGGGTSPVSISMGSVDIGVQYIDVIRCTFDG
jgi:hypothetical protein